jgi:hypothetical protein
MPGRHGFRRVLTSPIVESVLRVRYGQMRDRISQYLRPVDAAVVPFDASVLFAEKLEVRVVGARWPIPEFRRRLAELLHV